MHLNPPHEGPPDTNSDAGNSIPDFDDRGFLPPGIHPADWSEVFDRFGWNEHRQHLLIGLQRACEILWLVGMDTLYLNGSFVSIKDEPNDYDACWDMEAEGLDFSFLPQCMHPEQLHPPEQKRQFGGEFHSMRYMEIYQSFGSDPKPKGIVAVNLETVLHDHQD